MNSILLQPTDVLFFRDGRPMEGSLAGHGAAWPLPNVTDAAFHAALHRSGLEGHKHDQRRDAQRVVKDVRQFGSLVTAGPFPVRVDGPSNLAVPSGGSPDVTWFFPRPLDLMDANLTPSLLPTAYFDSILSSLRDPLEYAVANCLPPNKDTGAKAWLNGAAYLRYLHGNNQGLHDKEACDDSAFSDTEAAIGIGIDPETQAQDQTNFYSAKYLRLRNNWRLGVFARTDEKNSSPDSRLDLIPQLINEQRQLLVGGQQRLCTAVLHNGGPIPLPAGKRDGFAAVNGRFLVKWILLSPAIWPEIPDVAKDGRSMTPHPGGWLPNWVRPSNGQVMLRSGNRQPRTYVGKHTRGFGPDSAEVSARLVAAIVPKPIVVTGWALANDTDRAEGGAKSTHLAVPAGAVYYFEAAPDANSGPGNAIALANALNWHGDPTAKDFGTRIKNRRSTLMGEKGFGLGVCGTWDFFENVR